MKPILLITFLLLSVPLLAQQSTSKTKATVYIYKSWHPATWARLTFDVFLDETAIARLDRAIYLVAEIPGGRHQFRTKNKRSGGVELDVKAGEVYFLRLDNENGVRATNLQLSLVPIEQARFDLKQMKPIEKGDIKKDGEGIVLFPVPSIAK